MTLGPQGSADGVGVVDPGSPAVPLGAEVHGNPADEADIHAAEAAGAEADYARLLAEMEACRTVAARGGWQPERRSCSSWA